MKHEETLIFGGKKFISSRRAAQVSGYSIDYLGQLARQGKVESQIVGRTRFFGDASLLAYIQASLEAAENARKIFSHGKENSSHRSSQKAEGLSNLKNPYLKPISPNRDVPKSELIRHKVGYEVLLGGTSRKLLSVTIGSFLAFSLLVLSALAFGGTTHWSRQTVAESNQAGVSSSNGVGESIPSNSSAVSNALKTSDAEVMSFFQRIDNFFLNFLSKARRGMVRFADNKFFKNDVTKTVTEVPSQPVRSVDPLSSTATTSDYSRLSEADIKRIAAELANSGNTQTVYRGGVVTEPLTSDTDPALRVQAIRDAYSDSVDVTFDSSGTSGVIRPFYKSGKVDEYLFVLVPVEANTNE